MVRHQRVQRAVQQRSTQGIAVAALAQRRRHAHRRVEIADVHIGQHQRVDADVGGDGQALGLGLAHQLNASGTGDAAKVHARTGHSRQLNDGVNGDGLGADRHAGQAQTGGDGATGRHALAQPRVERAQPHGVAKGGGVLHGTLQHLGVLDGRFGLRVAHAAGFLQLGHLGQVLALEATGQGAQREQAAAAELARTQLEHLDQTWLVQGRVGIGQADHAGHAPRSSGGQFGLQHAFVFVTGFAQAHSQVHQARRHDEAGGVDDAVGFEIGADVAECRDAAGRDGQVTDLVEAGSRVDQSAVLDQDLHDGIRPRYQPGWTSRPCARRCRT